MFINGRLSDFFCNRLIKTFVHNQACQNNLDIDSTYPIIYLLCEHSKIDLFALREQCLQLDLPDPLKPIEIAGRIFPHYLYLQDLTMQHSSYMTHLASFACLNDILLLHEYQVALDVQVVLVSIIFGRMPSREPQNISYIKKYAELYGMYKFFSVCIFGRDSVIRFSQKVSIRQIMTKYGHDKEIIHKLIRVARIHFIRERLATVGPRLLERHYLLQKLLQSKVITQAIEEEAKKKNISHKKAQKNTIILIKEISANVSYLAIYCTDYLMRLIWEKLYQGINIRGSQRVLQLAQRGHTIVYVPCHKSHMDYLLLSYILYHQGLFLPHIAAGINLNFWPVGTIFRYLGAFFIRREFKCNKLYSTVFREYLGELFDRGYSVEYFVEGGRSRSGYLRSPKTGMLLVTLQSMLRATNRPISLVPIYIGYEHVLEVRSYKNELRGMTKKKEGFRSIVHGLRYLRNFGQSYVNFGEPLSLVNYLNRHIPEWRKGVNPRSSQHPAWLTPVVHNIAQEIMIRINNAAAVNAINLSVTALLAAQECSLTRQQLMEQLACYLQLLKNVPYSLETTIPNMTEHELIEHALCMKKIKTQKDSTGQVIILPEEPVGWLSYYRNNIYHMLVVPSLIATILIQYKKISRIELYRQVGIIYPILKSELFLRWHVNELPHLLDLLVSEFARQEFLRQEKNIISLKEDNCYKLKLLASGIRETLQLYTIILSIWMQQPQVTRKLLVKKSSVVARRLSVLCHIRTLEFCDKAILTPIIFAIYDAGYIKDSLCLNDAEESNIQHVYVILSNLISQDIKIAIESTVKNHTCI
ncbi:Glycerol-3-phosphate acyltransferase [Candidatus Erwinia haradaeae]|uniref:Glycerol-3-phosphate acyltransferase n=2 Tax=Candidatus Erwinia haradaeae TaxID=1922217 RepID=A0A451D9L3_9GAMM|nr:Glycerol-3-phosphate acyltransferase [Candidatus Erwinia haradaeae]